MNVAEIVATADAVLRAQLRSVGLDHIEVEPGRDHDDEDALFVTAYYAPGSRKPTGEMLVDAHSKLRQALLSRGEERFPYLAHQFGEDDRYEDEEGAGST